MEKNIKLKFHPIGKPVTLVHYKLFGGKFEYKR